MKKGDIMAKPQQKKQRTGLPQGYTPHTGGPMPVDPDQFVNLIIRTAEGLGHSGVMRAKLHEWDHDLHPEDGIGAVVGYRLATRDEVLADHTMRERWPEK